jgi:DNA-binding HxlR family transcriptional regulator
MDIAPRSGCPINAAVEVLGDPWATLVLRDIMFGNRRHFRELIAGSEERIATNILASRLKQLVAAGLLTRDDARRGQRAAYSLTEAGIPDHGRARQLGPRPPSRRAPPASDQLHAAYETARPGKTSSEAAER